MTDRAQPAGGQEVECSLCLFKTPFAKAGDTHECDRKYHVTGRFRPASPAPPLDGEDPIALLKEAREVLRWAKQEFAERDQRVALLERENTALRAIVRRVVAWDDAYQMGIPTNSVADIIDAARAALASPSSGPQETEP